MIVLSKQMSISEIIQTDGKEFFAEDQMIKAVADVDQGVLAVNASLHADLEELLLDQGSRHISILFQMLFSYIFTGY